MNATALGIASIFVVDWSSAFINWLVVTANLSAAVAQFRESRHSPSGHPGIRPVHEVEIVCPWSVESKVLYQMNGLTRRDRFTQGGGQCLPPVFSCCHSLRCGLLRRR